MHRSDAPAGCRMRSCGEHDVSIAQPPPVVHAVPLAVALKLHPILSAAQPASRIVSHDLTPPEPPPPRFPRLGNSAANSLPA
jgi:hypothetical protein